MGDNYDVVTILPHATVSENVILVVRDRLNANEVKEVIDKLAKAAEKTRGTLSFRNGKLFGHFTIVVNKCQVNGHKLSRYTSLCDLTPTLSGSDIVYAFGLAVARPF